MRRRLDLAMTLVGDPRIIFLDEPTAGLDPRSRRVMWQIVRDLVAGGVTIFLTTQYLEEADRLAHRIAVLDGGKIVAEGTPDELKRLVPGGHVRLEFIDPAELDRAAATFDGAARDDEALTLQVPSDGGVGSLRDVLDRLDAASIDVGGLSVQTPDLDNVFLSLTSPDDTRKAVTRRTRFRSTSPIPRRCCGATSYTCAAIRCSSSSRASRSCSCCCSCSSSAGRSGPGSASCPVAGPSTSPTSRPDELLRALREVATGGSVIDPKVVEGLLGRRQEPAMSLLETLSSREMEVLSEMAQGKSNTAISDSLYISPSGVEKHINAIFAKLTLSAEDGAQHRRVAAVLTFLRNQDLRRSPEARS
jgi:DNA-binding CsgD family transcriptional regulator